MADKNGNTKILAQVAVPVLIAILVGSSAPWWWQEISRPLENPDVGNPRMACEEGDMAACANLGAMYDLSRDDRQAVALYRQACNGGNAEGCNGLGFMYMEGRGVAPDDRQAVALYRQTCNAGNAFGCASLGFMYENGRGGVVLDDRQALALYRQACNGGETYGCARVRELREYN